MPRGSEPALTGPLENQEPLDDAWAESRGAVRQSYKSAQLISGVVVDDVPVFRSPDGLFTETVRLEPDGSVKGLPGFRPVQWNWSLLQPGAVKAWHLHVSQEDLWIVPPDATLLVGLADVRRSASKPPLMRFVLGAGKCQRLLIPRGVAHGVANLTARPQSILYAVNEFFTAEAGRTDEWRLPWDHFKFAPKFWEMERG
jgi:dTDP-4-dehydrorhamnose 3,5-epimerase